MIRRPLLPITVSVMAVWFGLSDTAGAAWARHGLVTWSTRSTKYPVVVDETGKGSRVRIFVPVKNDESELGYFVIRTKERLPVDQLEFRSSMNRWRRYEEMLKAGRDYRRNADPARKLDWENFYADVERFESMKRVEPETRDGAHGIFLDLSREEAVRTYLVHDFLPWGGSMVRDGGLWLTYDLPSFVEQLGRESSAFYGRGRVGDQFRVRKVDVREAEGGSRSFRVAVEKLSKGQPDLRALGLRLRVFERGADGRLIIGDLEERPEWDTISRDWPDAETKDLVLNWKGSKPERTYAGFSVDLICANKLQDAWASAPEFRALLLAIEPLDCGDLGYPLRSDRLFRDSLQAESMHQQAIRENNRQAAEDALLKLIGSLETLSREYPKWEHADAVESKLAQARKLQADAPIE